MSRTTGHSGRPTAGGRLLAGVPHMLYGADYNPEQWPKEIWREDARLMREAGVNLVSLGIFSWALLEPEPGVYHFDWLDEVMDLLHAHDVCVDLATATASPPAWLASLHPDSLPVTADGVTLWPGSRQQYCPSSTAYRGAAATLVRHLAERYRDHPALAMWHINNEYAAHVPACYCDVSAAAFRLWLRRRYHTIEQLNAAWGTAFWSQHYRDWEDIGPPRAAPYTPNPTQQLDWMRFSSDELLGCFEMERAILRELTPGLPVTTNFMCFFKPLDYWKWAAREEIVSVNIYTDPADARAHIGAALNADLMRSLGGGRPWMVMEQTPSQVNWRPHNLLKRPGQMRLWSLQAVARGADAIMFFQWRAAFAGAEKFHGAMVPHVGTARSRVWDEVTALGAELKRLDPILGAAVPAEVAMVLDWESWWALELDSKPSGEVRQVDALLHYYTPLFLHNIAIDFVRPDGDLGAYRVLLVPNLYQVRAGAAEHIARFVEGGGALVTSFFSGIADERDHILLGGYPAPFRALLGLRVEEFSPLAPGQAITMTTLDGAAHDCTVWSDLIDLEGATAIARYQGGFLAGRPAVTRHHHGRGVAYYLGTQPDDCYMETLLLDVCRAAGVAPVLDAPPGVEVTRRAHGAASFLFALNHKDAAAGIAFSGRKRDLLTGVEHDGALTLDPYGAAVLAEVGAG